MIIKKSKEQDRNILFFLKKFLVIPLDLINFNVSLFFIKTMKKIWLLTTLLIGCTLIIGCNKSENSEIIINETQTNSFWIFHDIEEWTITLDNWEESITIMDRNLWAEVAWTWEESYWYYFQRWNNHWFQLNSEIKTWKDLVTRDVALQYWPNNWYDSDVQFVIMDNT